MQLLINNFVSFLRESFSFRASSSCTPVSTNYPSVSITRRIRLSNRYENQSKVRVCLNGPPTNSEKYEVTCRKGVLVTHHIDDKAFPRQPTIPKVNVMNLPPPVEDVSFWEHVTRYAFS